MSILFFLRKNILFSLLKDEFKRAYGIFQQDGLAAAANYSVLNLQAPNREWKKVEKFN
jgi:hypothetical protein